MSRTIGEILTRQEPGTNRYTPRQVNVPKKNRRRILLPARPLADPIGALGHPPRPRRRTGR